MFVCLCIYACVQLITKLIVIDFFEIIVQQGNTTIYLRPLNYGIRNCGVHNQSLWFERCAIAHVDSVRKIRD